MTPRPHILSKSRFLGGLQCKKRLYLDAHHPDLAEPPRPAERARMQQGTRIQERLAAG